MKLKQFAGGILLVCLPFFCAAQGKVKTHDGKTKLKAPAWSTSHQYRNDYDVYFPDYYTFYDPYRGYVYWSNGKWVTSTSVPSYMTSVDLNTARMEVIRQEVEVEPETQYIIYRERYPAKKVQVVVPVPDVR